MEVVYPNCAGLDVHKKSVTACRVRAASAGDVEQEVQTFGTMTVDLLALLDWLQAWDCTHVAMESTGVYWKPIFNLLEGHVEVMLVNARHIKQVPGRKTDVKDAQWLAQLLRVGLLKPSFIPAREQRDLRDLTRYRTKLVQERAREVNRVQKVLEDANIKLASVATNIFGMSGRDMLAALVAGERDPQTLAELARGRLRAKLPQLEQALQGVVREHHRFLLAQQLAHVDFLDEQLDQLQARIEACLEQLPWDDTPPSPDEPGGATEAPSPPAVAGELPLTSSAAVALLATIPGVSNHTAAVIVAELGLNMAQFPSAQHAAAWAGLAPGNHESAGKRKSGRTTLGNRALRAGLSQAAWAAARTKDTYLAAQYRQLARRRGKKRAIVAVAHSMLVSAYHMLAKREPYHELGGDYLEQRKQDKVVNHLVTRLQHFGYSVALEPVAAGI